VTTDTADCRRMPSILATLYYWAFRILVAAIPNPYEIDTMVDILDGKDQDA